MHRIVAAIGLLIFANILIYSIHHMSMETIVDSSESYLSRPNIIQKTGFTESSKLRREIIDSSQGIKALDVSSNPIENWFQSVIKRARSNLTKSGPDLMYNTDEQTNTRSASLMTEPIDRTTNMLSTRESQNLIHSHGQLHAVTYASHSGRDDRFCRAVESAIRHGFHLVILGWGVKWEGLSQKLDAAHKYALSLPKDDIILFTDAFDVMFANTPTHVQTTFEYAKHDLIFGAECGCWPHVMEDRPVCFNGYPKSPTPYRYLNSGTWIGRAKPAADMLQGVINGAGVNFANANDQKLVADMYINQTFDIKLDFYCSLFQSMHMTLDPPLPYCNPKEDMFVTDSGHWENKRTKMQPAVFHFNGGGKQHHLGMERQVWYKKPEHNTREKLIELGNFELTVPTQPTGKMRFKDLCSDYMSKQN